MGREVETIPLKDHQLQLPPNNALIINDDNHGHGGIHMTRSYANVDVPTLPT